MKGLNGRNLREEAREGAFLESLPDLREAVWELVRQIPVGRIATYGDLARALGDDRARSARWLGELLKDHPHDAGCVCHRVVRSNGEIGLHVSGDPRIKAALLNREGVAVSVSGAVDLAHRFTEFNSRQPLAQLRAWQQGLADRVRREPLSHSPQTVGAVDVAYSGDVAHGAYVLLDFPSLTVLRRIECSMTVEFPYLPGYLTFRELPVLWPLCRQARDEGVLADVLFVDGNGTLHPWRAGIATCLGVLLDRPVIGVGKSLLCGRVDLDGMETAEARPVTDGDEVIGMALKSGARSRPIFVSVGNRMPLPEAVTLTRACFQGHRLPEPVYHADRLTKLAKP